VALQKSSPKTRSFAFDQTKAPPMEQSNLRDMFRKTSKSVCTSTILASPNPLSPTPTPSATKTPENTKDDPKPGDEENIKMEYSSD
jgi:hypothetical protein